MLAKEEKFGRFMANRRNLVNGEARERGGEGAREEKHFKAKDKPFLTSSPPHTLAPSYPRSFSESLYRTHVT
jgi:hypothetical protein